jgi:hypothetical protein
MAAETTMVDPFGRECAVVTPEEINNLLARGYTLKQEPPAPPSPRPAPQGE